MASGDREHYHHSPFVTRHSLRTDPPERVAYPGDILGQRSAARLLVCRNPDTRREKAQGAGRVVERDAFAVDPDTRRRFIRRECCFEHLEAIGVELEILEIVMQIVPSDSIIVKDADDLVCRRIESDVVETDIAMD